MKCKKNKVEVGDTVYMVDSKNDVINPYTVSNVQKNIAELSNSPIIIKSIPNGDGVLHIVNADELDGFYKDIKRCYFVFEDMEVLGKIMKRNIIRRITWYYNLENISVEHLVEIDVLMCKYMDEAKHDAKNIVY
jgi:hypothetical protein